MAPRYLTSWRHLLATDVLLPCVHVLLFARKMASLKSDSANLKVHSTWNSMPFKFPHKSLKSGFVHESLFVKTLPLQMAMLNPARTETSK
jgi:hypothetical protein